MKKVDPYIIRNDFPMYKEHNSTFDRKPLVYLDNSATTFKPYCVIDAVNNYYKNITSNTRRGDYSLAAKADAAFENARETIAKFINADKDCICFTSGDTMGLNTIAYMLEQLIQEGDEILLSKQEHASNALPFFNIAKAKRAKIKYVDIDKDYKISLQNYKKALSGKTKIVSLAQVSNVLGYPIDIKEFVSLAHSYGALYISDDAQSIAHLKTDVKDSDVDFLAFSSHKMLGPTGVGVFYGKKDLLEKLTPLFYGGEMNARFDSTCKVTLADIPYRFEPGTQNIEGALGLEAAVKYIQSIGLDAISEHEIMLKKYAVSKLRENKNVIIYNPDAQSGILTFNIKNVFSQDVATYLSSRGVFVRSGTHCAKMLPEVLNTPSTIRASFYIYNTKEDVDALVEGCLHAEDFLDAFFY